MKLILGTAQLGLSYGITNNTGLLSEKNSIKLLNHAIQNNITTFDSARAYGKSEYLLGKLKVPSESICIMTKLSLPSQIYTYSDDEICKAVMKSIDKSLEEMKRCQIDILLLHKWEHYLLKNKIIWKYLIKLKKEKVLKKIGVSIYNVNEANVLLDDLNVDIIQMPLNILDHQWFNKSFCEKVKKRKDVEIYCRSIYLQGILISDANKWPKINIDSKKYVKKLEDIKEKYNFKNKKELNMSYVKSIQWVSGVIIGVDNIEQLKENIEIFKVKTIKPKDIQYINNVFSDVPNKLINPRQWN